MTTPLTASLTERAQMKYDTANPQKLSIYLAEGTDNSTQAIAKNIDLEIYNNQSDPNSNSICTHDDGTGLTLEALMDLTKLYSSFNAKHPISGQPSISKYGVGFHDKAMSLSKEVEIITKHEENNHPFRTVIDYKTCTATIPTEVIFDNPSPAFTKITMKNVDSRHLDDLYNDSSARKRFIAQLEAYNRIAILEHDVKVNVSFFKNEGGDMKLWKTKTLAPSPLVDRSKTIPGGILSKENKKDIIPVEMSPFVDYMIGVYVKKDIENTYTNKDLEMHFHKIQINNDYKTISTTLIEPLYSTNTHYQIISVKDKHDYDSNKLATARIFPSMYNLRQTSTSKLNDTHVLLGQFQVLQYCYKDSREYGVGSGISIQTAEKHTTSLKCEVNAQASGQQGRYESTYGCIVKIDPAITGLSPSITDHFIHLLQEKACIDVSCFHPDLINILMFQRGEFVNFLGRHNKKVGNNPIVSSTSIPTATVESHTRCEHVRWRAIMERAQKTMTLSIQPTLYSILQRPTIPGTDEIADAATQIETDMNNLLGRIKDFQTLVTTPP